MPLPNYGAPLRQLGNRYTQCRIELKRCNSDKQAIRDWKQRSQDRQQDVSGETAND